jgi:hypothetical protein
MGRSNNGLPGQNKGAKAHGYKVMGHAHATNGQKAMDTSKLSKACAKAYMQGFEKGRKDKKASVGMTAVGVVLHSWDLEQKRLWDQMRHDLTELRDQAASELQVMDKGCVPTVAFLQSYAESLVRARHGYDVGNTMNRALVEARAADNRERAKHHKAVAEADVVELTGGPFAVEATDGTILGSGDTVRAAVLDAIG